MASLTSLYPMADQLRLYPQSTFGFTRKMDIHTGVDVYCNHHTPVNAFEPGVVVAMGIFTGLIVDSPWWNTTEYLVIKSGEYYTLYGEITIDDSIRLGDHVDTSNIIGNVDQVIKASGGKQFKNPPSMLHVERYDAPLFAPVWNFDHPKPDGLLNPTDFILSHLP